MKYVIEIGSRADDDVDDIAQHISFDHFDAALRFYDAVAETYSEIESTPMAWQTMNPGVPGLGELRKRGVKGFRNFLVVYTVERKTIKVLGVFPGSRDLPQVLARELLAD